MILNIPLTKSFVKGINIAVEHYAESLVGETSKRIVDEYLRMCITNDGSNPVYCNHYWEFCFTEAAIPATEIVIKAESECAYIPHCFRKNEKMLSAKVFEGLASGRKGLFLHIATIHNNQPCAGVFPLLVTGRLH